MQTEWNRKAVTDLPADGRQSETALRIQRGTSRLLREAGFAVLPEFTLASGRRADIAALGGKGDIWIVEIKSSPMDFYSDGKWHEYWEYLRPALFRLRAGNRFEHPPRRRRPHRRRQLGRRNHRAIPPKRLLPRAPQGCACSTSPAPRRCRLHGTLRSAYRPLRPLMER